MLDYDPEGNIVQVPTPRDPRLLTGSELYGSFFGIDRLYPAELGDKVDAYGRLLRKAVRSDAEEATLRGLYQELKDEGVATVDELLDRLAAGTPAKHNSLLDPGEKR